jgi:hypothetical protein
MIIFITQSDTFDFFPSASNREAAAWEDQQDLLSWQLELFLHCSEIREIFYGIYEWNERVQILSILLDNWNRIRPLFSLFSKNFQFGSNPLAASA